MPVSARFAASASTQPPGSAITKPTKTRATFFTAAKVAAARRNIERFPWATATADAAVARADVILSSVTLDDLWRSVTPQSLPRSYAVNQALGSPITGKDIFSYGNYGWLADPLAKPWKIEDPSSGYVFPTNDFGTYYESGRDETGVFNPDRADRSLLINELYPERGKQWGVDDGYGWVDDAGTRWTFIAYYVHWWVWYGEGHGAIVGGTLNTLRDAWLYTGDPRYAIPALVLLDRIADVYPAMDTGAYRREDGYLASDGMSDRGKIVGSIWETLMCQQFAFAYDALYPALADATVASEVVAFLSEKSAAYRLPTPKTTIDDVQVSIENNILRQIFPAVLKARIYGNFGMHQAAIAIAAVALDAAEETRPWLEWIFRGGGRVSDPEMHVTGGNVLPTLVNEVDRDGFGAESAPAYNQLWYASLARVADVLDGYDGFPAFDLHRHPKFQRMFENWPYLTQLGTHTPTIGDFSATGKPGVIGDPVLFLKAFERTGNPALAIHAWRANGMSMEGLNAGIFSEDPAATLARVNKIIATNNLGTPPSVNLTGYGFAALRHETVEAWLYYGRTAGHGHRDALNLGMHGFGLDLLPDLGYPEFCDLNPKRLEWTENTVSHNTVVVNNIRQKELWVGTPRNFAHTALVKLVDVEAPDAYPECTQYRRVVAQISTGSGSYLVDIFRVKGGTDHHYSFHAVSDTANVVGTNLVQQQGGTYAGPGTPYPATEPTDDYQERPTSGFAWLDNVERSVDPVSTFSVDWPIVDNWKILPERAEHPHVRLTMVGNVDDIALATGYPPRNKPGNPKALRYLLAHRTGVDLTSQFTSIIEAYQAEPLVASIASLDITAEGRPVTEDVVALRVTLGSGRVDTIVSAVDPDVRFLVDGRLEFQGSFGVISEQAGMERNVFLSNGTFFAPTGTTAEVRRARVSGRVVDFTRKMEETNHLVVEFNNMPDDPAFLTGLFVYVENDGVRNAAYLIEGAIVNESGDRVVLDIGRSTLIRGYSTPHDAGSDFIFDIEEGAGVTIPLHYLETR